MKKTIIALSFMAMASTLFANGMPEMSNNGHAIQTFAPEGSFTTLLTVNSTTTDLTNKFMYGIYGTAATCKFRLMPTSSKGTYVSAIAPATTWIIFAVNKTTPFLNLSGCTGGYKIVQ